MKTQTPTNKTPKGQRGFTLIETSIAMVVMMVGALAMSSLFVFSMQNNVGGAERALAMAVAQQELEQLRSVSYEDSTLTAGTTSRTVTNGTRSYTVQSAIVDEKNPNNELKQLKRITITVTPQAAGPSWLKTPVVLVSFRSTLASGRFAIAN
jgi:prepilin-type N-terminal cleavage/methylation domain-containing protein